MRVGGRKGLVSCGVVEAAARREEKSVVPINSPVVATEDRFEARCGAVTAGWKLRSLPSKASRALAARCLSKPTEEDQVRTVGLWIVENIISATINFPRAYLLRLTDNLFERARADAASTGAHVEAYRRLMWTVKICAKQDPKCHGEFDPPAQEKIAKALRAIFLEDSGNGADYDDDCIHGLCKAANFILPEGRVVDVLRSLVDSGEVGREGEEQLAGGPKIGEGAAKLEALLEDSGEELYLSHLLDLTSSRLRSRVLEEQFFDEPRALPPRQAYKQLVKENMLLNSRVRSQIAALGALKCEHIPEERKNTLRLLHDGLLQMSAQDSKFEKWMSKSDRLRLAAAKNGEKDIERKIALYNTDSTKGLANDQSLLAGEAGRHHVIVSYRRLIVDMITSEPLPATFQVPSVLLDHISEARANCRAQGLFMKEAGAAERDRRELRDITRSLTGHARRLRAIDQEARSDDLLWVYVEALACHADELAEIAAAVSLLGERARAQRPTPTSAGRALDETRLAALRVQVKREDRIAQDTPDFSAEGAASSLGMQRRALASKLDDAWFEARFSPGTFVDARASALYHYHKHAQWATGQTMQAYAEAAQQARGQFVGLIQRSLSSPHKLLRMVDTRETYLLFTEEGKIVSYRDRRSRLLC